MAKVPFIGPTYPLANQQASVQRTVNMMPLPLEPGNERAAWVMKDTPGLVRQVDDWPSLSAQARGIALFHFQEDASGDSIPEFTGATSATDQTGATWTAGSTDWLLPASSPSPKFGSGYLRGPSGVGATIWTRDAVQADPDVPGSFARASNEAMALDLWAYLATGTSVGNAFWRIYCNGEVLLGIDVQASGGVTGSVGGNDGEVLDGGASPLDQWFHVRLNYDGTTARLSVGGTVADSAVIDLSSFSLINGLELTANSSFLDNGPFLDEAYANLGDSLSTGNFTPPTVEWTV